ncbi:hypothetical protein FRC14_006338 [Serendipita sp. 396]|nr:hypothetical protein FRC14_006338 [Serendipita sp. 396]KAG8787316.1 hypothetical protein FRC15_009514 [Serendipita sp. 397]KAG8802447.1 hypothetical protein FRC16_009636 [Serendipita sp. 398]KAG8825945.1 hypothetical protein FRC19_010122 [Serendipita sp. 401]KAG8838117.1 hypothetical protein FRC18_006150 [Serendipita sp. 400]KAG8858896.1 hypothetical protein FRB91_009028 [Serendipita sp. 411]KAG8872010.1 hypothetical protein FRC20_009909 [Serendipita sp. 405]KAG9056716.1 hypothetical prot
MSLVAPRSFPLIERPVLTHSISSDPERFTAARRLVLIGNARVQLAPPVAQRTRSPNQPDIESPAHIASENTRPPQDTQPKAPEPLSSVARRKLRLANSSVPSYPFGTTPPSQLAAASPSLSTKSSNTSSEGTNDRDLPELAPVGVVDMRFLTRQPPSAPKAASKAPKSTSKSSSAGTPTSPSVPLAATAPKNQRPKPTAAADGKLASDLIATSNDDENKEKGNDTKPAFLFRPGSQQPSSGPYIRYSPMYHYYHPYRNLHREAIKTEWARLHPVVERPPPPQEEEVATPPRRTSGRQKKGNGRGVGGKGRSTEKGKKGGANAVAAAAGSQGNENPGNSPPPASGRRSRAAIGKGKGATAPKGQAKGKGGKGAAGPGSNKRKRGEFEEDEKAQEGKEDNAPTPPTKRPRRGAAAVAAALAAAQEAAEDAGSAKDEPSPTDAQDESERIIKRRMRPNARKTAAARAAAMVAKKRKSAEEVSAAGSPDDNEEDDGAESGKEEDGATKHEGSQRAESPHDGPADLELPNEEADAPLPEVEPQEGLEQDIDHEQEPVEKKTKNVRGKGGNTRGGRGKNRRGGVPAVPKRVYAFSITTRGTPRGTPKSIPNDDETASVDMGESTRAASIDATVPDQDPPQLPTKPPKSKRANGNKKGGSQKASQLLYQWGTEANGTEDHEGTPQTEVMDDVQTTLMEQTAETTQTQSQEDVATSLNPSDI